MPLYQIIFGFGSEMSSIELLPLVYIMIFKLVLVHNLLFKNLPHLVSMFFNLVLLELAMSAGSFIDFKLLFLSLLDEIFVIFQMLPMPIESLLHYRLDPWIIIVNDHLISHVMTVIIESL